jgi:hypothetical protein
MVAKTISVTAACYIAQNVGMRFFFVFSFLFFVYPLVLLFFSLEINS